VIYTLEGIRGLSQDIGCTTCHTKFGYNGAAAPAGGLPFDGCRQDYIDNGTYAAANVETDPLINANYSQDCVYWHLKNQAVADDPYYADYAADAADGRRVNLIDPDHSMLLYNPYCGPENCAANAAVENHPVRIFFDKTVPPYILMRSWVADGATNNYDQ
jgi:hypothetical protein